MVMLKSKKRKSSDRMEITIEFYIEDCLKGLDRIKPNTVDMVFADPPYNLDKKYYSISDNRSDYFEWMKKWMKKCYAILRPGGAAYFMNAPKNFGQQEAVIKSVGFEISSYIIWMRRNPAPAKNTFPNIHSDIHYCIKPGGKKYFDDSERISYELRRRDGIVGKNHRPYDVWIDIPKLVPGFMAQPEVVLKPGKKKAMVLPNQLPEKLVWRCVRTSTKEGDLVVDPFLGVGTTMRVCGKHNRNFIGFEINEEYRKYLEEQRISLLKLIEDRKLTQSTLQLSSVVK